jgi:YggT family protein
MIRTVMNILASLAGFYSLLIVVRVLLSWFTALRSEKPVAMIARITDPYLDFWRRTLGLRVGVLDISPLAALASLSLIQTVCAEIAGRGRVSLGVLLAIGLSAVWSAVSVILVFSLVVLVLYGVAFLSNRNIYHPFWRIIDAVSQPLLRRTRRMLFGRRQPGEITGILASIAALALLWTGGKFAVGFLAGLLYRLPV